MINVQIYIILFFIFRTNKYNKLEKRCAGKTEEKQLLDSKISNVNMRISKIKNKAKKVQNKIKTSLKFLEQLDLDLEKEIDSLQKEKRNLNIYLKNHF